MATGKHSATSCDVQFTYLILNWGIAQRGPAYVSVYSYAVPMLTITPITVTHRPILTFDSSEAFLLISAP